MVQFYKSKRTSAPHKKHKSGTNATLIKAQSSSEWTLHNQLKIASQPPLFVTGMLPNEVADVRVLSAQSRQQKGVLHKLHKGHPQRIKAHCQYAIGSDNVDPSTPKCGGCTLAYTPSEFSMSLKQDTLATQLAERYGVSACVFSSPLLSDTAYRRKVRLSIDARNLNAIKLGFKAFASERIVGIEQCVVCLPSLQQLLSQLNAHIQDWSWLQHVGHITLLDTGSQCWVGVHAQRTLSQQALWQLAAFGRANHCKIALYKKAKPAEMTWPIESADKTDVVYAELLQEEHANSLAFAPVVAQLTTVDGDPYPVGIEDFVQVNAGLNAKMVNAVLAHLALTPDDTVLDLFCGTGNFTLPIARRAGSVIAVEGVSTMVQKAQKSAQQLGLTHINWQAHDLHHLTSDMIAQYSAANKILVDPARAGVRDLFAQLNVDNVEKIVYVSCNPATWLSDIYSLFEAGFVLENVTLMDMFRYTQHTELLSVFKRP